MNKIIFVGRFGKPSMKSVYALMRNGSVDLVIRRRDNRVNVYSDNAVNRRIPLPLNRIATAKVVIRYGNTIPANFSPDNIVYNKSKAIDRASDKAISRVIFHESGVATPKLFHYEDYLNNTITYPVIARPPKHCKGMNFVVLNTPDDFIEHYAMNHEYRWYYSEFIDKDAEYRVHCAHGKVLGVMQKPKGEGHAWNRAVNHDPFVRVKQVDYNYNVCIEALKAVTALGLDFGGVDVITKDGKAYVLEVNTAPTINSSQYISAQYAKYFDWLMDSDVRKQHWDYTQFRKAPSLAWKQEQLINN